jgi:hypothetical protein
MADQLFLSYWLRGFSTMNMLRHFEKMLRVFPFSPQSPGIGVLRIQALRWSEPPLAEDFFETVMDPQGVVQIAREHVHGDCTYQVEGWWDLWQYDGTWRLRPFPVSLLCIGPEFEDETGDHMRIELGVDSHFLPQPDAPDHAARVQSNVRGLVRMVHEMDAALAVERRLLWTESGGNFADRLAGLAK